MRGVMRLNFEERTEERLSNHGDRIRELEIKDATQNERIVSLCKKMEELAVIIEQWMTFASTLYWKVLGAAGGLIAVLAAFFFWYIQSLPR